MKGLNHQGSIRVQLIRIIVLTCCAALLGAFAIFSAYDLKVDRESELQSVRTLTRLIGNNSATALAFHDDEAGRKILGSLRADSEIQHAALYTSDGNVLVTFSADSLRGPFVPPQPGADSIRVTGNRIASFFSVKLNGVEMGTIYVESSTARLAQREKGLAFIGALSLLISLSVALMLGSRLQRDISAPILELARTAFKVSVDKNYSVRAATTASDEIAFLYKQFNEMLEGIQARDAELRETRADLERRVTERTAYLNALVETSPLGIVTLDSAGCARICNRAFEDLFGYSRQEVIGAELNGLILPAQRKRESQAFEERRESGETVQAVTQRHRKDGSLVDVELYAVSLCVNGQEAGNLVLYHDITERTKAEEALRAAKEAAESANRAKSEFLANMSHEIRTPMNGIIGMTQLALESEVSPEVREYLGMVESSADSLLSLLNDILDYSKIEAGKIEFESEPFALRESLGLTMKTLAHSAHRRRLELAWKVAHGVPEWLVGDCGRLRQILVNLVGNAIKFTEKGEVAVSVDLQEISTDSAALHFAVRDTGIGIRSEKKTVIFAAFTQADTSITRKYGGTGLGLAIVQRLVSMMGGDLWVESEMGRGSTFHFTVRLRLASKDFVQPARIGPSLLSAALGEKPLQNSRQRSEAPPQIARRTLRVLLAEDNEMNRRLAMKLLEKRGHSILAVTNGREALEALERGKFDLVLMDVQMPELDGLEAIRIIRRNEKHSDEHLPIISVTARAMRGDQENCLRAGADGYVSKPLRPSDLFNAIDRCCPRGRTEDLDEPDKSGIVNEVKLLERCQGDYQLLAEIVELFAGEADDMIEKLAAGVKRRDAGAVAKTAHTLKGSIGIFTGAEPYALASALEHDARRNDLSAAEANLVRLRTEVEHLRRVLRRIARAGQTIPASPERV